MARRRQQSRRRVHLRRAALLVGVVLVGYLYYHPLQSYFGRKHDLALRRAEVDSLREQNAKLERQLKTAGTPAALAREARMQLSLVKPGERLFIVKGIEDWRRRN
jgi:cell division protein FtsB